MDKVSVTKTQANSNTKILKTYRRVIKTVCSRRDFVQGRFCLVKEKSIKANGTYPLFYQRVQLV